MQPTRNLLPAGHILTITADANTTGTVQRMSQSGDSTNNAVSEIAATETLVVGPFTQPYNYEILSTAGQLAYTITIADATATSAGLAGALSDETGTGAAVFGTAPTLAGPLITQPQTAAAVNGAVAVSPGTVVFTKAGVAAMTLAAPTAAQAGTRMTFVAGTANAHTITATGLIDDGITGGSKDLATFEAFVGASLTLEAYNLKWVVVSLNAVTIT